LFTSEVSSTLRVFVLHFWLISYAAASSLQQPLLLHSTVESQRKIAHHQLGCVWVLDSKKGKKKRERERERDDKKIWVG